jgi:hypothetical protein
MMSNLDRAILLKQTEQEKLDELIREATAHAITLERGTAAALVQGVGLIDAEVQLAQAARSMMPGAASAALPQPSQDTVLHPVLQQHIAKSLQETGEACC